VQSLTIALIDSLNFWAI